MGTWLAPCWIAFVLEAAHFESNVVVRFGRTRMHGLSVCQPLPFGEDSVSAWRRPGVLLDGRETDSGRTGHLSRFFPDDSPRYRFSLCRLLQGSGNQDMGGE